MNFQYDQTIVSVSGVVDAEPTTQVPVDLTINVDFVVGILHYGVLLFLQPRDIGGTSWCHVTR